MNFWEKLKNLFRSFPKSSSNESYEKIRKEDMGFIGLCLCPVGFVVSGIFYFQYNAITCTKIIFFHMILVLTMGLLRKSPIPNYLYQNTFVFFYYSLFTLQTLASGGIHSQSIYWLPTLSIVAGSFLTRKATLLWALISFVTVSLFFSGVLSSITINEIPSLYRDHYLYVSTVSMIIVLMMISLLTETDRLKVRIEKEDAIRSANRAANLASLGEVAGGIAHEINNPLMIVSGSAMVIEKAMKKEEIDREKVLKHTNTIKRTSQRAAVIIKGLKTLSRDGEFDAKESCTLGEIFEEVVTFLHAKMRGHEVELQFDHKNKLLNETFSLFRVQFSQVVLNLIKNSIEAVDGYDEKWIRLEVKQNKDESITIRITDSGKGIPEEVQNKMFTPFFTTKPLGVGTGLGLPLCFSIIEKSGGQLQYDNSSPNTTFTITLPKEAIKGDEEKDEENEAA